MKFHYLLLVGASVLLCSCVAEGQQTPAMPFLNIESCFDKPANERQLCLDDFVHSYVTETTTTKQLLASVEDARTKSDVIERECHPIVHAIGRWTYQQKKTVGDSFNECDQTCHSGCFHGVMERMFYSDEQLASGTNHLSFEHIEEKVPGICDAKWFSAPSQPVIFQCLHGLGHALLFVMDYNLELALKGCDLLRDTYEKSSCYGGLFMENVTSYDPKKRDLKKDDPLYPCNKVDGIYRSSCYLMQTSVMREYGLTMEEMAKECRKATPNEHDCFVSLGRDYSNSVRTHTVSEAVDACEKYSTGWEEACINGVTYALVDNTWDASFAYTYCDALTVESNKQYCFWAINDFLQWAYRLSKKDVQKQCDRFSGDNKELCYSRIP